MPLHPALVHVPLALIPLAFLADWIGFAGDRPTARTLGGWCWFLGWCGAAVSVALGYFDMSRAALAPDTHDLVHLHLKLGWLAVILLTVFGIVRFRLSRVDDGRTHGGVLLCGALLTALLLFQGWFGGEMVYGHGAGVAAANQGVRTPAEGRASLEGVHRVLEKIPGLGDEGEEEEEHDEHGEQHAAQR